MIFLDANFLISLFVENHEHNKRAVEILEEIQNRELIISNSIIMEVITVLNTKLKVSKDTLKNAYISLNHDNLKIVDDTGLYDETMQKVINLYPKRFPFFDCLYIVLMEELGIKEIVSFDKHFNNIDGIERIY